MLALKEKNLIEEAQTVAEADHLWIAGGHMSPSHMAIYYSFALPCVANS